MKLTRLRAACVLFHIRTRSFLPYKSGEVYSLAEQLFILVREIEFTEHIGPSFAGYFE